MANRFHFCITCIHAQGPSEILTNLFQLDPAAVTQTFEQAAAIDKTFDYLLSRLRINVAGFVETIG